MLGPPPDPLTTPLSSPVPYPLCLPLGGVAGTRKAPSFEGARVINLLSKHGAEGQSRTDTGSPPPVFEFDAGRFTLLHPVLYSPVP